VVSQKPRLLERILRALDHNVDNRSRDVMLRKAKKLIEEVLPDILVGNFRWWVLVKLSRKQGVRADESELIKRAF
jgi:hypothetical protein